MNKTLLLPRPNNSRSGQNRIGSGFGTKRETFRSKQGQVRPHTFLLGIAGSFGQSKHKIDSHQPVLLDFFQLHVPGRDAEKMINRIGQKATVPGLTKAMPQGSIRSRLQPFV